MYWYNFLYATVAQLVEQSLRKRRVKSSTLFGGSYIVLGGSYYLYRGLLNCWQFIKYEKIVFKKTFINCFLLEKFIFASETTFYIYVEAV